MLRCLSSPRKGFQSHPNHLELVDSYLRTWVETGVKTGAFIHDADVYAADPADLTRQFAPAVACNGERAWYFYTQLRHKSVRGERKARTVAIGSGCWHSEKKPKPVSMVCDGKNYQIGNRQSFAFVNTDTGVRVRTGWLMIELSLLKNGGAGQKPEAGAEEEAGALGSRVLCKVYRSPRKPEPSGSRATAVAASPGHKAEGADDDDESSDATWDDNVDDDDNDDRSNAWLELASGPKTRKFDDVESSEATVAAPSRHSKANDKISGGAAAAPGRNEKAVVGEDSVEMSAATPPPRKRKALDDESSGAAAAAAGARKKKADGRSSPGRAPVSAAEMQCPQCATHLVVTLKRETEPIAKDESAPGAWFFKEESSVPAVLLPRQILKTEPMSHGVESNLIAE